MATAICSLTCDETCRRDALRGEVAELAAECAPRRFALCWLDVGDHEGDEDGGIAYWGMEVLSGLVIVADDEGRPCGVFSAAEQALRVFGRRADLTLVWLDPRLE